MGRNEKTILVIDDDLDLQFVITTKLKSCGFRVRSLIEGKLNSTFAAVKGCDIVLLDVKLPGLSGVELGNKLKSSPETQAIPIILLTGHSDGNELFVESKANALFSKPFSLAALLSKIKELLPPPIA
jgi:response regulator RpfG family c-di-GMP phosphodiesterase